MSEAADRRRALIERHIADVVVRVERVRFVFGGQGADRDNDGGELQLWFAAGIVVFRAAGDGEHLEVLDEPWSDPFAPPLSSENEEFVRTHGAWQLVDVSTEPGYRGWVGKQLASFTLEATKATLALGDDEVSIAVDVDELFVSSRRGGTGLSNS